MWWRLSCKRSEPHTPPDIYAYYIERICVRIKKVFPEATVIFATSIAVLSDKMSKDFKRYNEEIVEYNRVAVEIVKKYGFAVNE